MTTTSENQATAASPPDAPYNVFVYKGQPISPDEKKTIRSVVVDSTVKEIPEKAFADCTLLSSISIAEGVTSIGNGAFDRCYSLKKVVIPKGVTTIAERLFFYCGSLESIDIPEGVTSIGSGAFDKCSSLEKVVIPKGVITIGDRAFRKCSSLKKVVIPKGVTTIAERLFFKCHSLESIDIPEGVISIGDKAFRECSSLISIQIPEDVTTIGEQVFKECSLLLIVAVPSGLQDIDPSAFDGCKILCSVEVSEGAPNEAKNVGIQTIADQLKIRFKDLPLHEACYHANLKGIESSLKENSRGAEKQDKYNLNPLHILAINPNATGEMIRLVADNHPDAMANSGNALRMCPIHLASRNLGKKALDVISIFTDEKILKRRLMCTVLDKDSNTPTILSIRHNFANLDMQRHLFKFQPCDESNFLKQHHRERVTELETWYVTDWITSDTFKNLDAHAQNGWVGFVSNASKTENIHAICDIIRNGQEEFVRDLGNAKDSNGRKAFDVAVNDIKKAFCQRLYFLGRYELVSGPPIHKSDTCIVVGAFDMESDDFYKKMYEKARGAQSEVSKGSFREFLKNHNMNQWCEDEIFTRVFSKYDQNENDMLSDKEFLDFCKNVLNKGKHRKVAIKFMKNEDQFSRELLRREALQKKSVKMEQSVVSIDETYDAAEDNKFKIALESLQVPGSKDKNKKMYKDYKYAVIMPCADRNLEMIARSEQPDPNKTRSDLHQIATKLNALHQQNIIHGDLKMQNIVRMGEKLWLIDLDASAMKNETNTEIELAEFYVGQKFSSGILPPEMIFHVKTEEQMVKFKDYFKHTEFLELKKIMCKKSTESLRFFCVKTFNKETIKKKDIAGNAEEIEIIKKGLPYAPVEATEAIDLWSFGTIMYFLCTKRSLFTVDVNDDLVDGDAMEQLYSWNDEKKIKRLDDDVEDPFAKELLRKLLSKKPEDRGRIRDLLDDPYFTKSVEDLPIKSVKILLKNGFENMNKMIKTSFDTLEKNRKIELENMGMRMLNGMNEATTVQCPTAFVVLREELPSEMDGSDDKLEEGLQEVEKWVAVVEEITEIIEEEDKLERFFDSDAETCEEENENSEKPPYKLLNVFKEKLQDIITDDKKTVYLYLVDELTGEPVTSLKGYPKEITSPIDIVPQLLPCLQHTVTAITIYNGVAGIFKMFGIPKVPSGAKDALEKTVDFLSESSSVEKWKVVHNATKDVGSTSRFVRGASLCELEKFFDNNDSDKNYRGLHRILDYDGYACWTAVEGAKRGPFLKRRQSMRRAAENRELELLLKLKKEGGSDAVRQSSHQDAAESPPDNTKTTETRITEVRNKKKSPEDEIDRSETEQNCVCCRLS